MDDLLVKTTMMTTEEVKKDKWRIHQMILDDLLYEILTHDILP